MWAQLQAWDSRAREEQQEPYLFSSKRYISAAGGKPCQQSLEGAWYLGHLELFRLPFVSSWEEPVLPSHFLVPSANCRTVSIRRGWFLTAALGVFSENRSSPRVRFSHLGPDLGSTNLGQPACRHLVLYLALS